MLTVQLQKELSPGRRLIGAYAELPAISGPSFLPISFLGRLPTTMVPLAILTFVASSTGSFAAAGLATTATAAGTAVGAPLMGRLADRHGQRPVLSIAVLVNTLALAALALRPESGRAGLLVLCALIGLSMPPVGGMARARWLALSRRHAGTAMAYEGTADEVSYVLGPAVAGLLASTWGAPSALLAAALAGLLAVGAFALHPTHTATHNHPCTPLSGDSPTLRKGGPARSRGVERLRAVDRAIARRSLPEEPLPEEPLAEKLANRRVGGGVMVPVLAMLLMGTFFAATQSALTVLATGIGRPAAGGLIYAVMAVGSAVTALGTAAIPARFGPRLRCAVAASGLLIGVALMATAGSVPLLCAAVLFTGLSVGPMLVTLNQVAGAAAPMDRVATTMAYLSVGSVVGIALGATSSGALADASGSLGAFAVAAAASVALLALALAGLRGDLRGIEPE